MAQAPPAPKKGNQKLLEETIDYSDKKLNPDLFLWKVLLGGESGSGKTTIMTTLPGRKLLIDSDNRASSVLGTPNLEVYSITDPDPSSPTGWFEVKKLISELWTLAREGEFPFDSVIFDGLTSLNRTSMNWALTLDDKTGLGGSPAQQHYNPQMHNLSRLIFNFLALPCHVGLTCHMDLFEDEDTGVTQYYPKMFGKTRTEISAWFNETYLCEKIPAKKAGGEITPKRYQLRTEGTGQHRVFKSSLNQRGKYWDDPILLDLDRNPAGFEELFQLRFGKGGDSPTE